jgi:hypothetical protein
MNLIKVSVLILAFGLWGCSYDINTYNFENYEELSASKIDSNGEWFSMYDIPRSATNIEVKTDVDSGTAWVSFDYDIAKEREFFKEYDLISVGTLRALIDQGKIVEGLDIEPVYINCDTMRYVILENGHAAYLSNGDEEEKKIVCGKNGN